MDLDKYITDNIDEIINNPNEFLNNTKKNKKKISKNNDISLNQDEDDIYGDDYDDFGFIYKKYESDSSDSDDGDDKIISNEKIISESNEDDYTNDIIDELYQDMYDKKYNKITKNELEKDNFQTLSINGNTTIENKKNDDESFEDDDGYYIINLINIFMLYYNNKFDKKEHFFSGVKDTKKDTSAQMELFFETIDEYKLLKKLFNKNNEDCMKLIYINSDQESKNDNIISELFLKWKYQIYMLELKYKKYISPSLLVCLNYIYENNIIDDWNIYNLRNIES